MKNYKILHHTESVTMPIRYFFINLRLEFVIGFIPILILLFLGRLVIGFSLLHYLYPLYLCIVCVIIRV